MLGRINTATLLICALGCGEFEEPVGILDGAKVFILKGFEDELYVDWEVLNDVKALVEAAAKELEVDLPDMEEINKKHNLRITICTREHMRNWHGGAMGAYKDNNRRPLMVLSNDKARYWWGATYVHEWLHYQGLIQGQDFEAHEKHEYPEYFGMNLHSIEGLVVRDLASVEAYRESAYSYFEKLAKKENPNVEG